MATVTHKLELPSGAVPTGALVQITLVASSDLNTPAEGHAGGYSVGGEIRPVIDATGTWSSNLIPNAGITPAGTVYRIVETLPGADPVRLYITVPTLGGRVEDLLTTFPGALPGPTTLVGPPGPPGAPGVGFTPAGIYNAGTTYLATQAVYSAGQWWGSLAAGNIGHDPATTIGVWWGPLGISSSDARVVNEKLNVMAPPYSMPNNGSDGSAGLLAAIAALPATGSEIFFPPGLFAASVQAVLDNKASVKLSGVGGLSAGAAPASMLRFTQSGSGSALSARSTLGFVVEDLSITANNAGFTGALIDLSHGSSAADSAYTDLSRCFLFAPTTAGQLLLLDKAISCTFRDVVFNGAAVGVLGRSSAGSYSNAHSFVGCTFLGQLTAEVRNPGLGWGFIAGCTFENLSGGGAGALLCDAGYLAHGLAFMGGCWFGDGGIVGDHINFLGSGLTIVGNYIGGGNVGVRLPAGIVGATITGNQFDQINSNAVVVTNGGKNVVITGNDMSTVVGTPVAYGGGSMPTASMIQNDGQDGVFLTSDTLIVAGPVSDGNFPVPPPNGTRGFDSTNLQAYIRVGGTWRKSAAYT